MDQPLFYWLALNNYSSFEKLTGSSDRGYPFCGWRRSPHLQNAESNMHQLFEIFEKVTWWKVALGGSLSILPATLAANPAIAAERIYISYGLLGSSIAVDSLETFARDGEIPADLSTYARYATPTQLEELRDFLQTRAELSPVAVAQFLYTEQGETLLSRVGEVIQTEARQSGFYAIRAALILAAADPEGLTPLNVLKKFPLPGIRVDVERTLEIARELERLIYQTSRAIAMIERQSALEAARESVIDFASLPDLVQSGRFTAQKDTIRLHDPSRDRTFETDLYLPLTSTGNPPRFPVPVIVISHGLGSDRTSFAYLANHLTSHGYAVAVPDHPGSNAEQLQALLEGEASEVIEPREFIDRPLDIRYLLDRLEQLSQSDPQLQGRLDVQNIGVVGQSFGGYTALVLAGAELNFSRLQVDCTPEDTLNLSLLLQCRALEIDRPATNLQDHRVKAIIAINPIGSSLLGKEGFSQINLPVMVVTGNADTVAPSLLEQIYPFTWLTTPNRHLLLLRGGTHFSTIGKSTFDSEVVELPPEVVGPDPALARRYLNAMSVAFFKTYINNELTYFPYLGSGYARYISQATLPLRMVQLLTSTQLAEALEATLSQSSSDTPDEPLSQVLPISRPEHNVEMSRSHLRLH
jgi:predicted dienelactone hydrolase